MKKPTKLQQATKERDDAKIESQRLSEMLTAARREIEDMHVVFDAVGGVETRTTSAANPYNRKALTLVQRAALTSLVTSMARPRT